MQFLQSLLLIVPSFLFVLTLVVVVHELGHYWAARSVGTKIDQFSIGFGRAILHWRDKQGVQWRVGWLPLGGYVRFAGDENAASVPDQDDLDSMRAAIVAAEGPGAEAKYFQFKPIWQRAWITVAGPFANFVLAIALFASFLMAFGEPLLPARVVDVAPNKPAAAAGFQAGDIVTRVDGHKVRGFDQLERYIQMRAGAPIVFGIDRGGRQIELTASPVEGVIDHPVAGRIKVGQLGIFKPPFSEYRRVRYNPIEAVGRGAERSWDVIATTVFYVGRIITGKTSADQIGSVLGIADTSGKVARAGAQGATSIGGMISGSTLALLELAAFLSVSIGFMNLLPLPVLDGGHLVFYAYEAVARRPLPARIQAVSYRLGLALLVGFMLFATWNDLQRLRVFNFLGGLFS